MSINDAEGGYDNVIELFPRKPEFDEFDEDNTGILICNHCDGYALEAYRQNGYNYLRCAECGTDQTETYFGS